MANHFRTARIEDMNNKVNELAGRYFFDSALSGSGWAVLAMIVEALELRSDRDEPGHFDHRAPAALARASRLLSEKPADFGRPSVVSCW